MKSRNKKRLLALVLCMVVAISNSSFIFASETGQTEYPQEVQTQDEAVADDMDVAAYAADEGQAVADEQPWNKLPQNRPQNRKQPPRHRQPSR